MTPNRFAYSSLFSSLPLHTSHPAGTLKFWTPPSSEPPAQIVMAPTGLRPGRGYGDPLMVETSKADMVALEPVKVVLDSVLQIIVPVFI